MTGVRIHRPVEHEGCPCWLEPDTLSDCICALHRADILCHGSENGVAITNAMSNSDIIIGLTEQEYEYLRVKAIAVLDACRDAHGGSL